MRTARTTLTKLRTLVAANKHSFKETRDDYVHHHFLFAFHDSTLECLSDDLSTKVVEQPYGEVLAGLSGRVLGMYPS
jgi:hypothetical protein